MTCVDKNYKVPESNVLSSHNIPSVAMVEILSSILVDNNKIIVLHEFNC